MLEFLDWNLSWHWPSIQSIHRYVILNILWCSWIGHIIMFSTTSWFSCLPCQGLCLLKDQYMDPTLIEVHTHMLPHSVLFRTWLIIQGYTCIHSFFHSFIKLGHSTPPCFHYSGSPILSTKLFNQNSASTKTGHVTVSGYSYHNNRTFLQ